MSLKLLSLVRYASHVPNGSGEEAVVIHRVNN